MSAGPPVYVDGQHADMRVYMHPCVRVCVCQGDKMHLYVRAISLGKRYISHDTIHTNDT